ncbi:MAG: tRNA lysidine(34) synthetase TilS [Candidatus Aminicenantes bacterium]|nr:tRNA lysidine(34) synthetase TilS [Candidatus Aminicenantes bacterium]
MPSNNRVSRAGRVRQTFLKTLRKGRLLEPGERVLVAWSGGQDSTALVRLLLDIRRPWSLEVIAAHFNHGLRPAARRDEAFVRRSAAKLGIPLVVGTADVRGRARREGLSTEEAARFCRYEFLNSAAEEAGASKVATGHTMNDQAETVLLRLVQGAGSRGLAGIHPAVQGRIIRPLLEISGEDIRAFLRERRLRSVRDESNRDRRFLRNRIRLDLIPVLARKFNPDIVRLLARTADILREEDAFLDELASKKAGRALRGSGPGARLETAALARLPRALARRVVRRFVRLLKGDLRSFSYDDVEDILTLGEGKEKSLAPGVILMKERGCLGLKTQPVTPASYRLFWDGKKRLGLAPSGMAFRAEMFSPSPKRKLAFDNSRRAYLDAGKIRLPLEVRPRRPGDRYRPLGASGSKKLKEILRAKGIVQGERERLPVFLSGGKVAWAPGLPAAEEFKVGGRTRKIFLIEKL